MKSLSVLVIALTILFSCKPAQSLMGDKEIIYTKTTSAEYQSKSLDCDFDIFTSLPQKNYDEIGVININKYYLAIADISTFKLKVKDEVCKNGGDAVVVTINGSGHYVQGTVLKYK